MELPNYQSYHDFEENLIDGYASHRNDITFIEYLKKCKIHGDEICREFVIIDEKLDSWSENFDEIAHKENSVNYIRIRITNIYENIKNEIKFAINRKHYDLIISIWNKDLTLTESISERTDLECLYLNSSEQCSDYIDREIERERIQILRGTPQPPQDEPEPLTAKQQQKVGLLIRSGIIDFLREKNPGISNNKISGFIELLTTEPMKKSSITSHLVDSTNNVKHPFYSRDSLDEIDLKLKQFGISSQSE